MNDLFRRYVIKPMMDHIGNYSSIDEYFYRTTNDPNIDKSRGPMLLTIPTVHDEDYFSEEIDDMS